MKILNVFKYVFIISSGIYFFIDWKIGVTLLIFSSLLHVFPLGPYFLLKTIVGYLIVGGILSLFFDWMLAVFLLVAAFSLASFNNWARQAQIESEQRELNSEDKIK